MRYIGARWCSRSSGRAYCRGGGGGGCRRSRWKSGSTVGNLTPREPHTFCVGNCRYMGCQERKDEDFGEVVHLFSCSGPAGVDAECLSSDGVWRTMDRRSMLRKIRQRRTDRRRRRRSEENKRIRSATALTSLAHVVSRPRHAAFRIGQKRAQRSTDVSFSHHRLRVSSWFFTYYSIRLSDFALTTLNEQIYCYAQHPSYDHLDTIGGKYSTIK